MKHRIKLLLESRPLTERRVNWPHKFYWLVAATGWSPSSARTSSTFDEKHHLAAEACGGFELLRRCGIHLSG